MHSTPLTISKKPQSLNIPHGFEQGKSNLEKACTSVILPNWLFVTEFSSAKLDVASLFYATRNNLFQVLGNHNNSWQIVIAQPAW